MITFLYPKSLCERIYRRDFCDRAGDSFIALYKIGQYVGSVFQHPRSQYLPTNMTNEIAFGCRNMSIAARRNYKRVATAFHFFDIEELWESSFLDCKGGEK